MLLGTADRLAAGEPRAGHRRSARGAGRRGAARPRRSTRSAGPSTAGPSSPPSASSTVEQPGPGDRRARAGHRAARDRHSGDRCPVPARPRPARADRRRPRRPARPRSRSTRSSISGERRDLRLRRGRPEVVVGQAGDRGGAPARRLRTLHLRDRRAAVPRPGCSGSRPMPASPWASTSATGAATSWSWSTI